MTEVDFVVASSLRQNPSRPRLRRTSNLSVGRSLPCRHLTLSNNCVRPGVIPLLLSPIRPLSTFCRPWSRQLQRPQTQRACCMKAFSTACRPVRLRLGCRDPVAGRETGGDSGLLVLGAGPQRSQFCLVSCRSNFWVSGMFERFQEIL